MDGFRIIVITGMGVITYALRVLPLCAASRLKLPAHLVRWFQYVSFSIIAGFVWLAIAKGSPGLPTLSFRGLALLTTILVAVRFRNPLLAMMVGVGFILGLSHLAGGEG